MATSKRKNEDDEDWKDTTQMKTIKKNDNEKCIICCTETTESLSSLNSLESALLRFLQTDRMINLGY